MIPPVSETAPGVSEARRGRPSAAVIGRGSAYLLLAALVIIWGANWPVMKVGIGYISPLWFAFARLLLGGVTFAVLVAAMGQLKLPPRHDIPIILSLGLFQMGAFLILVTVAVQFVPAGRSALLAYTHPLWVAPGAVLLLGERLGPMKLTGLAVGLLGLIALFNPAAFPWSDPWAVFGNGLLLLAAFLWGLAILHARRHRWIASPFMLAPWAMLAAAPPVLLMALFFERPRIDWSPELAAILLYNGPVATAFGYWASVTITRALPALTTSIGLLGVPVMGLLSSMAALGEPLTWSLSLGLIGIVLGLALVNLADLRSAPGRAPQ
jgi:drug/metabolite transporter (DMT)-like permease